mmetsp:Transcript_14336/g.20010  ORF Transcript_14336/g.20010 Transcript_14336/m.20010 type:complete len:138 (-) Transcript_14336:2677-3090(-)
MVGEKILRKQHHEEFTDRAATVMGRWEALRAMEGTIIVTAAVLGVVAGIVVVAVMGRLCTDTLKDLITNTKGPDEEEEAKRKGVPEELEEAEGQQEQQEKEKKEEAWEITSETERHRNMQMDVEVQLGTLKQACSRW